MKEINEILDYLQGEILYNQMYSKNTDLNPLKKQLANAYKVAKKYQAAIDMFNNIKKSQLK